MQATLGPSGLQIPTQMTLTQLAADVLVREFAAGLIPQALEHTPLGQTLGAALYHSGPEVYPLLTGLLVLDAEVQSQDEDEVRTFPLPGFLTYRANLPPDKFPPVRLRLPPLNPDGHFIFAPTEDHAYLALRFDLNPILKVLGHVRIAASSPTRFPVRLRATEHRLDRQTLTRPLLEAAIAASPLDLVELLTQIERDHLIAVFEQLLNG